VKEEISETKICLGTGFKAETFCGKISLFKFCNYSPPTPGFIFAAERVEAHLPADKVALNIELLKLIEFKVSKNHYCH